MTEQERNELESLKTDHMMIKSDVHRIAESVIDIAESVKKIVEIKHHMELLEQRQEDRHVHLKEADRLNREELNAIKEECDKNTLAIGKLPSPNTARWLVGGLILYTIAFGIYVEQSIKYNENQITYIKGRIK